MKPKHLLPCIQTIYPIHTVLEALVVWVQEEVLEAIGDVVVSQELQIVLIKLKFQWVLVMDLEREGQPQWVRLWPITANHTDMLT